MEGEIILKVSASQLASDLFNIVKNGGGFDEIGNYLNSLTPDDIIGIVGEGCGAVLDALEIYEALAPYIPMILAFFAL